jgi:hypothetical protein
MARTDKGFMGNLLVSSDATSVMQVLYVWIFLHLPYLSRALTGAVFLAVTVIGEPKHVLFDWLGIFACGEIRNMQKSNCQIDLSVAAS